MMNKPLSLDDVLGTIMIEEEEPSYEAMSRWVAQYPEYRSQIASFFATWAIQSDQPEDCPPINSEALASRGVSYALSLLDQRDAAPSLIDRARVSNLSVEQLAAQTNLDDSILQKLNRRLLRKVPRECVRRLAAALAESLDRVCHLITGPPILGHLRHKATRKPVVTQEDFEAAVKSSSLPANVQRDWLDIIEAEESELR